MIRLPTGSGVGRGVRCAASCVLPFAGHTGEAAEHGTEQHDEIEDGDLTRDVVRRLIDGATDVRHEVAYAVDIVSQRVREIGVGVKRAYGDLAYGEIALTVDLECRHGDTWWVVDWKSRARVDQAAFNWQLRCEAMAVMLRHGADTIHAGIGYLDNSELDSTIFDAFDVPYWCGELRLMMQRIERAQLALTEGRVPDVSAGSWCKYCPAIPHCPAHAQLALSMLGELDTVEPQIRGLTIEQCGRAWELLDRYDEIAGRVRDGIRARAKREPVPLSNGRRLALVECKGRRSLDQKKAKEMLVEAGLIVPMKQGKAYDQVREAKLESDEVSDV